MEGLTGNFKDAFQDAQNNLQFTGGNTTLVLVLAIQRHLQGAEMYPNPHHFLSLRICFVSFCRFQAIQLQT